MGLSHSDRESATHPAPTSPCSLAVRRYTPLVSRVPEIARTVKVKIPAEAFQHRHWDPAEVAQEMRVLWFLEEVRARRLGYGKAAELAGVPTAEFLRLIGRHQITPFDYDDDELAREIGA